MENFVISAQIWDLNQVFLKSLKFFPHKIFGVANDAKNELRVEKEILFEIKS